MQDPTHIAPIVLFVYNRPRHARRVLEALRRDPLAASSELIAFSDGPRSSADAVAVAQVRELLRHARGFGRVRVVSRPDNLGLAQSVIRGVSEVLDEFDSVIVLEDDLLVSPRFLWFMNRLLSSYRETSEVFTVTGYNYPPWLMRVPAGYAPTVYLGHRVSSWGWGTWRDRWRSVDWSVADYDDFVRDAEARRLFNRGGADLTDMLVAKMETGLDSWAVVCTYASFRQRKVNVYPVRSLVQNIGHDASGVHCGATDTFLEELDPSFPKQIVLPDRLEVDARMAKAFAQVFDRNILSRLKLRLRTRWRR